jgi:hypothetical protein
VLFLYSTVSAHLLFLDGCTPVHGTASHSTIAVSFISSMVAQLKRAQECTKALGKPHPGSFALRSCCRLGIITGSVRLILKCVFRTSMCLCRSIGLLSLSIIDALMMCKGGGWTLAKDNDVSAVELIFAQLRSKQCFIKRTSAASLKL